MACSSRQSHHRFWQSCEENGTAHRIQGGVCIVREACRSCRGSGSGPGWKKHNSPRRKGYGWSNPCLYLVARKLRQVVQHEKRGKKKKKRKNCCVDVGLPPSCVTSARMVRLTYAERCRLASRTDGMENENLHKTMLRERKLTDPPPPPHKKNYQVQ